MRLPRSLGLAVAVTVATGARAAPPAAPPPAAHFDDPCTDEDPHATRAAPAVAGALDPHATRAAPAVAGALDPHATRAAPAVAGALDPHATRAAPAVAGALDPHATRAASAVAGALDPHATRAAPAVAGALVAHATRAAPAVAGALVAPCTRHALDGFRDAVAAQRAGTADHVLRVSYFGDSLTADDHITNALRRRLQALVGDGGPGFVFAAPPHPYCQHLAIAREVSDTWQAYGVSTIVPPDHLLGLGGSAETDANGGTIRLALASAAVHSIDLDYLAQPHGGAIEILADGKSLTSVATSADRKTGSFVGATLPDGTKHIELRARGRVRLFGAALEAARGAVVDNLGVVNATAKQMRTHELGDHLRNQLAHRAPDLVVVMYGTNEAEWLLANSAGMAEHEQLMGELLAIVRAASPKASCLVVSPLDQLDWRDDKMPPRTSIPAMVEAQRRAAAAHGCAFWDTYAWMGGKGSSLAWFKHGLIVKDFQHPTSEGADRIADALYRGLVPN